MTGADEVIERLARELVDERRRTVELERRVSRLRRRNRRLKASEEAARRQAADGARRLAELRSSTTWRVGAVVTWPARRLKGALGARVRSRR